VSVIYVTKTCLISGRSFHFKIEGKKHMKNGYRTLLAILLILTISGLLGLKAALLLEDLFHYKSPLKDNPPPSGEVFQHPLTERVVIILMDGLRLDTASNTVLMPELGRMRTLGASATMTSQPPSYSEPGYATILTGAWPDINDGPVFNLDYEEIPVITQETIFTTANAAGLKTAISAYYWFEKLIPQELVDVAYYTPGEDREADRQVIDSALPLLSDNSINLLLIHIDQIDYAGHYEGGGVSIGWNEAATRSDQLLAELVDRLDLSTTTLLIFSDHGHLDMGGHGGHDESTLQEPFVAAGTGIIPGAYEPIQMVDIAPTIAILLGTSLPSSAEGRPLVNMLVLTDAQVEEIDSLYDSQQAQLIETYATALESNYINQAESLSDSQSAIETIQSEYLSGGRVLRSILASLFIGILVYIGYKNRKVALSALTGAIVFLLSFHILYSVMTGRPYSFSIITSPESFIIDAVSRTALSFLFAVCVASLVARFCHTSSTGIVKMNLSFTSIIMLAAGAPAFWYFILYGPVIRTILPDIGLLFRTMLSLLEVMTIGLSGLLLTGISAVVLALFSRHQR
jgi:hypothetical protein